MIKRALVAVMQVESKDDFLILFLNSHLFGGRILNSKAFYIWLDLIGTCCVSFYLHYLLYSVDHT